MIPLRCPKCSKSNADYIPNIVTADHPEFIDDDRDQVYAIFVCRDCRRSYTATFNLIEMVHNEEIL